MSSHAVLMRMARRQVWRNKLRSLLIIALIAFPVAAVTLGEVVYRSNPLSTQQEIAQAIGGADARVDNYGDGSPIEQSPDGRGSGSQSGTAPAAAAGPTTTTTADIQRLLPGARVIPDRSFSGLVTTKTGAVTADVHSADLADPHQRPALTLLRGSWRATPGQAVIGQDLARTTGVGLGGTLILKHPAAGLTVVGIVGYPYCNQYRFIGVASAAYDTLAAGVDAGNRVEGQSWLIVRPAGVSWTDVQRFNQRGLLVTSRQVMLNPPPKSQVPYFSEPTGTATTTKAAVTIAVAVGMAVLQLALLAGPAFAVSARRRQRDLALIAAAGGDRTVLRRTLLSEALVLGVLAALAGAVTGVLAAVWYRSGNDVAAGPLRLNPLELLGIGLLGVLAALIGAMLPAFWASSLDVVAALAGRRGSTKAPWRTTVAGGLALALGVVAGAVGASQAQVLLILPGLALCELGVLALTPGLLQLAGLVAPRLPLAARIAVRDASRNRTAAVPALAAVLAAVTASVSIAILAASFEAKDRAEYQPQLPRTAALVSIDGSDQDATTAAVRDLRQYLSTSRVDVLAGNQCGPAGASCRYLSITRPKQNECDPIAMSAGDRRCAGQGPSSNSFVIGGLGTLVLTPDQLGAVARTVSAADRAALAAGKVLLGSDLDESAPGQTQATLAEASSDKQSAVTLPAAVLSDPGRFSISAIVSPATARQLHLGVQQNTVLATLDEPPSSRQEQGLTAALSDYDLSAEIEHGYQDRYHYAILIALVIAAVVALGATALATGLAMVDSRPDLATLWAVGAGPGLRRRLSVARSAVVALVGVLLGTTLGFLPPWIIIDNERRRALDVARASFAFPAPHPFSVPWWPNIIGTAVLIPVAAMVISAAMTRARPPRVTGAT